MKKLLCSLIYCFFAVNAVADKAPAEFAFYLEPGKVTKGEIVKLDVPEKFVEFYRIIRVTEKKHPEWFKKVMEKNADGNPIPPFHANLGITKQEYDNYLKLWEQRTFTRVERGMVGLRLEQNDAGHWIINVSGQGWPVSLLSYDPKTKLLHSKTGDLKRIKNIKSPKESVYRAWTGLEWQYLKKDSLVTTKENFAIGKTSDGKYGLLFYSLKEMSNLGSPLADSLMIIRFAPRAVATPTKKK